MSRGIVAGAAVRATLSGLAAASVALTLLFPPLGWRWAKKLITALLLGWAIQWPLLVALPTSLGFPPESSALAERVAGGVDSPRLQLWRRAWVGIQQAPWLEKGSGRGRKILLRSRCLSVT